MQCVWHSETTEDEKVILVDELRSHKMVNEAYFEPVQVTSTSGVIKQKIGSTNIARATGYSEGHKT